MKAIVRFYEGSYQYRESQIDVSSVRSLPHLGSGVLMELNHQYNYRPTYESLWSEIICTEGDVVTERYRVTRLSMNKYKFVDMMDGYKEIDLPTVGEIGGLTFIN